MKEPWGFPALSSLVNWMVVRRGVQKCKSDKMFSFLLWISRQCTFTKLIGKLYSSFSDTRRVDKQQAYVHSTFYMILLMEIPLINSKANKLSLSKLKSSPRKPVILSGSFPIDFTVQNLFEKFWKADKKSPCTQKYTENRSKTSHTMTSHAKSK